MKYSDNMTDEDLQKLLNEIEELEHRLAEADSAADHLRIIDEWLEHDDEDEIQEDPTELLNRAGLNRGQP